MGDRVYMTAYVPINAVDLPATPQPRTLPTMNLKAFTRLALLTGLLLTACSRDNSPQTFADKFIAAENRAWSTGDIADLKAIEDTDVVYHLPGLDLTGWKAHEDFIL